MKSMLEASLKPTIHRVFPWLEQVKKRLDNLILGVATGSSFTVPH